MILVDTNVLIDIFQNDPIWAGKSIDALANAAARGPLGINEIIYAELAAGFDDRATLDRELALLPIGWAALTKDALALAGRTFRRYRREGGAKNNVLADFFIGAQASVEGFVILTRDVRRYSNYFPEVALVRP
ncbi:type II toxin-antitoxin system VapC family toxin [Rhodoblastus sp.]|uniref:type II toxin-antitoxin system VapC family toxin n=1 Tax=Rhodoblastus sp. TaxID=1962975 RepID=UPI003F9D684B